jgi:hypothetical protein
MTDLYLDPDQPLEKRLDDLVSRMETDEKISQLLFDSPAIPRLGIPEHNWWSECLHGVARAGRATLFPQAIAMAATFDCDLVKQAAEAISDEARAKHHAAVEKGNRRQYMGLTFWTPNVNIFRDPRWGRGQETWGEDPFLTSKMGVAFVEGLQGDHPRYLKIAACAKHYAVHSGPEKIRHEFNAQVNEKDLNETYLPAFKSLVDAGVEAVMGPYAANLDVLAGNYYNTGSRMLTFLEGIVAKVSRATAVQYRHAFLADRANDNPVDYALLEAMALDAVVVFMGNSPLVEGEEGDAIASAAVRLVSGQWI